MGRTRTRTVRGGSAMVVVLAAVAACAAPRGGEPTVLQGTVREPDGSPAAGALVTLREEGTGRAVTVYADGDGHYVFPAGTIAGTHRLQARSARAEARPRAERNVEGPGTADLVLGTVDATDEPPASRFLAQLPDGVAKRRLVVDCGGCHTFNPRHMRREGRLRTAQEWHGAIQRMVSSYGPGSGFPIVGSAADAGRDSGWLVDALAGAGWPEPVAPDPSLTAGAAGAVLTEYDLPDPRDLPHDLVVDAEGRVVITGMMTHRMYVLDPATGVFDTEPIPVQGANPRAVDIDADGRWWVLLGAPQSAARHDPATGAWDVFPLGAYPHSVAFDDTGRVWFNGHFTASPEIVGALDPATGDIRRWEIPAPSPRWLGESTIPYGLRIAPDGTVWGTQLRGNGLVRLDPSTGAVRRWEMPTSESGPRRLDVAPDGTVWIPEFGGNRIARFAPGAEHFTELDFPVADAAPYVVRVDRTRGTVWIGTGQADVVASLDPATLAFTLYPLPSRGALVRHVDVDERTGDLWVAYGASPGAPAKILRIQPAR